MIQWRARFVSKRWQSSPSDPASGIRPLQDTRINRIDVQVIYMPLDWFRWQSRIVIASLGRKQWSSPAYAAVQQLRLGSSRHVKVTAQFVLYQVNDWESRIYLYEPGFYYSFNFPAYYGKGQKTTVLLSIKPLKRITVSTIFSGTVRGENRKWETGIQLRLYI